MTLAPDRSPTGTDWYRRWGKRAVDIVLAVASLPVTAPLIALGWLAARVSTGDAGFFTQERVGLGGRPFTVYKLRTMRAPGPRECAMDDAGITVSGASRITDIGRWLRQTKLDELPQLGNVLRGDMSLVGPRPDVARWLDLLSRHPDALAIRPGLTSLASLAYIDEEELLADERDPVKAYGERILPEKLRLNELYARTVSPALDTAILCLTAVSIVSRPLAKRGALAAIRSLGGRSSP